MRPGMFSSGIVLPPGASGPQRRTVSPVTRFGSLIGIRVPSASLFLVGIQGIPPRSTMQGRNRMRACCLSILMGRTDPRPVRRTSKETRRDFASGEEMESMTDLLKQSAHVTLLAILPGVLVAFLVGSFAPLAPAIASATFI